MSPRNRKIAYNGVDLFAGQTGTPIVDGAAYMDATTPEIAFMRNVLALAKMRGWLCYHTHISKRSTEGWPDLAMVKGERMVIAELKKQTGRTTPAQRTWLALLGGVAAASNGALSVHEWRPSDWPEIERVIA